MNLDSARMLVCRQCGGAEFALFELGGERLLSCGRCAREERPQGLQLLAAAEFARITLSPHFLAGWRRYVRAWMELAPEPDPPQAA